MPNTILVIHDQPSVANALLHAFDGCGFSATAVPTADEALDYLCIGGQASVILYDATRTDTTWLLGRAQEANPALLRIPLIALSPLSDDRPQRRSDGTGASTIDLEALLLIVGQLCRSDAPPGLRQMSREP